MRRRGKCSRPHNRASRSVATPRRFDGQDRPRATARAGSVPMALPATVHGQRPLDSLSFAVLGEAIGTQGVTTTGPAVDLYRGTPEEALNLEVGFPTDRAITPRGSP